MHPRTVYYLFHGLMMLGMTCMAVSYVPFLLSLGLAISDVALINVCFWSVIVILEVPTGLLADSRSRAVSMKLGIIFVFLGVMLYVVAADFAWVLAAELISGVGMAFISGAEEAWIVDALIRRGESDIRRKVFATAAVIRGLAALVGGALGAFASAISLRFGFVLNAGILLAAVLVTLVTVHEEGESFVRLKEWDAFKKSLSLLRRLFSAWSCRSITTGRRFFWSAWALGACHTESRVHRLQFGSPWFGFLYIWDYPVPAYWCAGWPLTREGKGVGLSVPFFLPDSE